MKEVEPWTHPDKECREADWLDDKPEEPYQLLRCNRSSHTFEVGGDVADKRKTEQVGVVGNSKPQ